MSATTSTTRTIEADERQAYRVGGVCAITLALAYILIFPLYGQVGAPPTGGEAWLKYLDGKTAIWWAILGLSVLTDLLFVPFGMSLYQALKDANRNAMIAAVALFGLFVVLDLGVTWTSYGSLLTLSGGYTTAATDAQRTAYVAAAGYPSAVLASPLERVYAILILSLGILIIGVVMLKSRFGRLTSYLGVATGVLGIVALGGWGVAIILNAVFATLWILLSGLTLCRLARR